MALTTTPSHPYRANSPVCAPYRNGIFPLTYFAPLVPPPPSRARAVSPELAESVKSISPEPSDTEKRHILQMQCSLRKGEEAANEAKAEEMLKVCKEEATDELLSRYSCFLPPSTLILNPLPLLTWPFIGIYSTRIPNKPAALAQLTRILPHSGIILGSGNVEMPH